MNSLFNLQIVYFPPAFEGSKDDFASDSTTQWLAPVGVIGSLVIGLLAALLIFKRRSVQRKYKNCHTVQTDDSSLRLCYMGLADMCDLSVCVTP